MASLWSGKGGWGEAGGVRTSRLARAFICCVVREELQEEGVGLGRERARARLLACLPASLQLRAATAFVGGSFEAGLVERRARGG